MTDRLRGFIVTLDQDYRDDDLVRVTNAILQLKGVIDVAPVVADVEAHMAYARARADLTTKLLQALG